MPWGANFPDAPVLVIWLAVAVLGVLRKRRAAAVGAWLGTAGFLTLTFFAPSQHWWFGVDAGWVELRRPDRRRADVVAGTGPRPGAGAPERDRRAGRLGRRRGPGQDVRLRRRPLGHRGASAAGRRRRGGLAPWSRAGRRAALVLALPVLPVLMWRCRRAAAVAAGPGRPAATRPAPRHPGGLSGQACLPRARIRPRRRADRRKK